MATAMKAQTMASKSGVEQADVLSDRWKGSIYENAGNFNITARDNYSNNLRYRTNRAYALIGFNIEDFVRRAKTSTQMAEEKQDKEIKKVTERVISITKRGDVLKNEVAADNIRKETNFLESLSRCSWPQKYEHLTGQFFNQVLAEKCRKAGLPANAFERDPPEDVAERSPIPLKASPAFPRTTSAQIGHRSSRTEYSLEFMGRFYISPKWTIDPPADTPELRTIQQKFIFLG
ncbi:PREDICTED: uncharacterized protein LOC108690470 [Atta colombica]|uniref:uncharacterized protein LOC108690470 n=1 Tax=Atta colombica TaxID=520822 RepID=UPI00084CA371|nr:PREDICTED: uncharacterized protein LOC108690470 [Atta colombica]